MTRYATFSTETKQQLRILADEGHDLQARGVNHLSAVEYATEHGAAAYVTDEVLPSLEVLRADGYPADSFAYPGGARTDATDRAIEPHVRFLRTTPGPCIH